MNRLEKLLQSNIGKWCGIRYILPTGEGEAIYGILKEVNDDYVILDGFIRHVLNKKQCTIVGVELRYERCSDHD